LALVLEKERVPDLAKEIPARKVFWVEAPVGEVAALVLRDRASLVLRRVNPSSVAPLSAEAAWRTELK
jgi:hypothetical protein